MIKRFYLLILISHALAIGSDQRNNPVDFDEKEFKNYREAVLKNTVINHDKKIKILLKLAKLRQAKSKQRKPQKNKLRYNIQKPLPKIIEIG